MQRKNNKHIGSDFDSFLEEEGLLEEVTAIAIKRVIAWQIEQAMKAQKITKTEMAARMKTSRAALNRLLDETDTSLTLTTLASAAAALGMQLHFGLEGMMPDAPGSDEADEQKSRASTKAPTRRKGPSASASEDVKAVIARIKKVKLPPTQSKEIETIVTEFVLSLGASTQNRDRSRRLPVDAH